MPLAVVAVGGNSLIKDNKHSSVSDQYSASVETIRNIVNIIEKGWNVVLTHGNGPQVGFMLLRSEMANKQSGLHCVPLDSCGADTQGAIGYIFQQVLQNEFNKRGIAKEAVTIVTRTIVDKNDPAFLKPTKPIGPFMTKEDALNKEKESGWQVIEDSGRGYRRVVPSPKPIDIVEENAIKILADNGYIVIAVGGGGIPVYEREDGIIAGVEAVIDKDLASAKLAIDINADAFIITTAVDQVCINFGKSNEKAISNISVAELIKLKEEGHFAPGSMLPKIESVITFLEHGGKKAVITSPANIGSALNGTAGTVISN